MITNGKLAREWASYETEVVIRNPEADQKQEARRAFYAGAQSCFRALLNNVEDPFILEEVEIELNAFCSDVQKGMA